MNVALIMAAGSGTRMNNNGLPKQFLEINGIPLLIYALKQFENHQNIDEILVIMNKDYIDFTRDLLKKHNIQKVIDVVPGGDSRQQSVFNGLTYLRKNHSDDDIVLIHDAARVLIDEETISKNIEACQRYDAVTTAISTVDTIAMVNNNAVKDVPDRSTLYSVQTPQTFKLKLIYDAHAYSFEHPEYPVTDDSSVILHYGHEVKIVEGKKSNIKVTTKEDLEFVSQLLKKLS